MESFDINMERISLQRIYKRLDEAKDCKEDIQEHSTSMLANLINNTGEVDAFLIPHNKEYCSVKKIWKRLPVHIDRTITNIFKTLEYDIKQRNNIYTDLRELINRNILAISAENEEYNRAFQRRNLQQELQMPGTIGIYNDDGELIDVADIEEYHEYLEEYQREAKNDFLKKYLKYKNLAGCSFIDLLLMKQLKVDQTIERVYPKNISNEQKKYINKEIQKNNIFWKKFYGKKQTKYTCKICGEPVYQNEYFDYHICDVPLKTSKIRKVFKNIHYIHFHEKNKFQEMTNQTITLPEITIPNYKKEVLDMNNITVDFKRVII